MRVYSEISLTEFDRTYSLVTVGPILSNFPAPMQLHQWYVLHPAVGGGSLGDLLKVRELLLLYLSLHGCWKGLGLVFRTAALVL